MYHARAVTIMRHPCLISVSLMHKTVFPPVFSHHGTTVWTESFCQDACLFTGRERKPLGNRNLIIFPLPLVELRIWTKVYIFYYPWTRNVWAPCEPPLLFMDQN